MAVTIFLNFNQSETLFRELLLSFSIDRTPFVSTATKINLVNGFIFCLLVIWLQCHKISKKLNFFLCFRTFLLLLKFYHIILIFIAPIGLEKRFNQSDKIFRENVMV